MHGVRPAASRRADSAREASGRGHARSSEIHRWQVRGEGGRRLRLALPRADIGSEDLGAVRHRPKLLIRERVANDQPLRHVNLALRVPHIDRQRDCLQRHISADHLVRELRRRLADVLPARV
eukprot:4661245-Prymnesium_polylepis.4